MNSTYRPPQQLRIFRCQNPNPTYLSTQMCRCYGQQTACHTQGCALCLASGPGGGDGWVKGPEKKFVLEVCLKIYGSCCNGFSQEGMLWLGWVACPGWWVLLIIAPPPPPQLSTSPVIPPVTTAWPYKCRTNVQLGSQALHALGAHPGYHPAPTPSPYFSGTLLNMPTRSVFWGRSPCCLICAQ